MTVRFHLGCLATLTRTTSAPPRRRPGSASPRPCSSWASARPPPPAESVLHLGSTRLGVRLAPTTTGAGLQRACSRRTIRTSAPR
ncbi:hypothetical protein [Streptomyces xanthophaeus]